MPRVPGPNASKCPWGQSQSGAWAECRVEGPEIKHCGDEGKRTRQKVWRGPCGMPTEGTVQSIPNFRRPGGLGGENQAEAPGSDTLSPTSGRSCSEEGPHAAPAGRGRSPRRPHPRGQSAAAPGTERPSTEAARPPGSGLRAGSEEGGSNADWERRRELDLTASPSQVGWAGRALGQPAPLGSPRARRLESGRLGKK